MSSEDVIRYVFTLVGVAGLVILAVALGGHFGWWAAGLVLLVAGGAVGFPMWDRHFDRLTTARLQGGWEPPAKNIPTESDVQI